MTLSTEFSKGTLLFDGNCRFCRMWIRRWSRITGRQIRYGPYQNMLKLFPEVSEMQCRQAVQLILRDRSVYSGAHAVFKALALAGKYVRLLKLYESFFLFRRAAEWLYRLTAGHRTLFSKGSGWKWRRNAGKKSDEIDC